MRSFGHLDTLRNILYNIPLVMNSSTRNCNILITKISSFNCYPPVSIEFRCFGRPLRCRRNKFTFNQSPSSPLHYIYWIFRLNIMSMICSLFKSFSFVSWPCSLIVMKMTSLDDINFIFVYKVLKMKGQVSDISKLD